MENDELRNLLERIATALERIADCVENGKSSVRQETSINKNAEEIVQTDGTVSEFGEKEISENIEEEDTIEKFLSSKNIKIKVVPRKTRQMRL